MSTLKNSSTYHDDDIKVHKADLDEENKLANLHTDTVFHDHNDSQNLFEAKYIIPLPSAMADTWVTNFYFLSSGGSRISDNRGHLGRGAMSDTVTFRRKMYV